MGSLSKRSSRRWSFEGLIPVCLSVARRAYASVPKRKKVQVDGRSRGLCRQLAEMCSAICWQSAEQTSLFGGAWAVPLRSGLYDTAGGELMRPNAETRSVLRRAVSSARTRKMSSVWCVPGDQQKGPKAETRSVLRSAVSSARSWKVSSVWYVPGDQ